jgi:hypothetical protein
MENKEKARRIKNLTENLKLYFVDREDFVHEPNVILDNLHYLSTSRVAHGKEFNVDINKEGYAELETSYSNQKITYDWQRKMEKILDVVMKFNDLIYEDYRKSEREGR